MTGFAVLPSPNQIHILCIPFQGMVVTLSSGSMVSLRWLSLTLLEGKRSWQGTLGIIALFALLALRVWRSPQTSRFAPSPTPMRGQPKGSREFGRWIPRIPSAQSPSGLLAGTGSSQCLPTRRPCDAWTSRTQFRGFRPDPFVMVVVLGHILHLGFLWFSG